MLGDLCHQLIQIQIRDMWNPHLRHNNFVELTHPTVSELAHLRERVESAKNTDYLPVQTLPKVANPAWL